MGEVVVLLSGAYEGPADGETMRFRLTYDGELRPTQGEPRDGQRNPLAAHKHRIRQHFHGQLRQLWATQPFLRDQIVHRESDWYSDRTLKSGWEHKDSPKEPLAQVVADQYREHGYRFLPLVREQWSLHCSLSILFLRRDIPGSVIHAGDLDNRVKTVIDSLRRPRNANELIGNETPADGEDPFYVLMEDDNQVSQLTVETDTLLDPVISGDADLAKAKLVVTVELRAYHVTMFNRQAALKATLAT